MFEREDDLGNIVENDLNVLGVWRWWKKKIMETDCKESQAQLGHNDDFIQYNTQASDCKSNNSIKFSCIGIDGNHW